MFLGRFSRSWRKTNPKHVSRRPNIKFLVWPFLDLVALNDLDLEFAHRRLGMILKSVLDTNHVVALAYFHLIRLHCATKPDPPNRLTFRRTWLVTWSVAPRSTTLGFPRQICWSIESRLNFVNRTSSSWAVRVGEQKIAPHVPVVLSKYPCQARVNGPDWLRIVQRCTINTYL